MDSINERIHAQLVELANAYFAEIVHLNNDLIPGRYTATTLADRRKNSMKENYNIPKYYDDVTISDGDFNMTFPRCYIFTILARWEKQFKPGKRKAFFEIGNVEQKTVKCFTSEDIAKNGGFAKMKLERLYGNWWIDAKFRQKRYYCVNSNYCSNTIFRLFVCIDGVYYGVIGLPHKYVCNNDVLTETIKRIEEKFPNPHDYLLNILNDSEKEVYYHSVTAELGENGMQRLAELANMECTTTETAAPDEVPTAESNTETPTTESDVTTDDTPTPTETKEETPTTEFEPMTESEIAEIWNESFDAELPPTHRVNVICKGFESSAPAWGERMAESVAYYSRLKYPDGVVTIEVTTIATTEHTHESPPTKETPPKRTEIRQFSRICQKWINSTPLTVATSYGNLKRIYLSHFATAPPLPRKHYHQRWRTATASGDSDCAKTLSCASHRPNHFASANSPPNYFFAIPKSNN